MKVFADSKILRKTLQAFKKKNKKVGFVPTMGYLHQGHLQLIRQAKKHNDVVVVSIFVNPLQFGPKEDFKQYPRNVGRDQSLLMGEKTDILFTPEAKKFYSSEFQSFVTVRHLTQGLCGRRRPGHFEGVATVVAKLLNVVMPDTLYLGQKDYQQYRVLSQMVHDLDFETKVVMVPIVREKDGLALSSRNVYLSQTERLEALVLSRTLCYGETLIRKGARDTKKIKSDLRHMIKKASLVRLDYLEIVDAETLQPMVKLGSSDKALIAIAAYFGKTRLIDNVLVDVA